MAPSTRSELGWFFRENRPFLPNHGATVVCIGVSCALAFVQPLLMKWLIDDILPNQRWGAVIVAAGLMVAASVGRTTTLAWGVFISALSVRRMTCGLQLRLVRRVQSLSAEFHTTHAVGDLVQRLEKDVDVVREFAETLPTFARMFLGTPMSVIAMFYLDWHLLVVVLPVLPISAYLRHRFRTAMRRSADRVREAHDRRSSLLQEMLTGAIQIQLLGAEHRLAREYRRESLRTMRLEILQRRNELVFTVVSSAIVALSVAAIVGYGGFRVLSGVLTVGGLVAFCAYVNSIFEPMNAAIGLFAQAVRVQASIDRLREIEETTDVVRDAPRAVPIAAIPRSVTYQDVSFEYGPHKQVLSGVDVHVRAGERLAIVGESGCGKSSLLKLVPRLYDATRGRVEIDNHDIRSLTLASLRRAISFVPQDPFLFQETLRANLRYGSRDATPDEMRQAIWTACLDEVIENLPQGLDTKLGRMGAGLSGGERQRVAIARALLQQRPILILDEAFSALDSATEHRLLARLVGWSQGRILIVVSHRLLTTQWADRVVVMRDGKIADTASPDPSRREPAHRSVVSRPANSRATGQPSH